MITPDSITARLRAWRAGETDALDQLLPLVYEELRRLASRAMQRERDDHTLQTTALVHEAYLRLLGADIEWEDRVHFFAIAAQTMRRVLVDHARTRARDKRGGGAVRVPLDEGTSAAETRAPDMIALDEALQRLSSLDDRKARVVELLYFGGLTYDDTARLLGVSTATVDRDLRFAKAWLYNELTESPDAPPHDA
jgi:RNA polymerase sigma factor (TIGR02999 family)